MKEIRDTSEKLGEIDSLIGETQGLIAAVAVSTLFDCPDIDDVLADAWLRKEGWAIDIVCLREDFDMANCKREPPFDLTFEEFARREEPRSYIRYWRALEVSLDPK